MTAETLFIVEFEGYRAQAIRVSPEEAPARVLAALELPDYGGVIVVHGGAGAMEQAELDAVRTFVDAALIPLAEPHRLLVFDGATGAGVAQILGEARAAAAATFPLVGVAPYRFVRFPGHQGHDADAVSLSPAHTHFVFVDGESFGVESDLLVGFLRAANRPGLALIINGGAIVLQEVIAEARQGNAIVVVRGSGRMADRLADIKSEERALLPPESRLFVVDIDRPEAFRALAGRLLELQSS